MDEIKKKKQSGIFEFSFFISLAVGAVLYIPFLFFSTRTANNMGIYGNPFDSLNVFALLWEYWNITNVFDIAAFVSILKFALASGGASLLMTRFCKGRNLSVAGGICYASICSLTTPFYFLYHGEEAILFPLVLLSIEWILEGNKKIFLAVFSFFFLIVAPQLFIPFILVTVIYAVGRISASALPIKNSSKFSIFFELLVAVIISGFFLFSLMSVGKSLFIWGWDAPHNLLELIYFSRADNYGEILAGFFIPSTIGVFVPLFGMTTVVAFLFKPKKTGIKVLSVIMLVCAFIPATSYYLETNGIHWKFMLSLVLCLLSVKTLSSKEHYNTKNALIFTWVSTAIVCTSTLIVAFSNQSDVVVSIGSSSISLNVLTVISQCFVAIVSLILMSLILKDADLRQTFVLVSSCIVCGLMLVLNTLFSIITFEYSDALIFPIDLSLSDYISNGLISKTFIYISVIGFFALIVYSAFVIILTKRAKEEGEREYGKPAFKKEEQEPINDLQGYLSSITINKDEDSN